MKPRRVMLMIEVETPLTIAALRDNARAMLKKHPQIAVEQVQANVIRDKPKGKR